MSSFSKRPLSDLSGDFVYYLRHHLRSKKEIWGKFATIADTHRSDSFDFSLYDIPTGGKPLKILREICPEIIFDPKNNNLISLREMVNSEPLRISIPSSRLVSPVGSSPMASPSPVVVSKAVGGACAGVGADAGVDAGAGAGAGSASVSLKRSAKNSELDQAIEFLTKIRCLESRLEVIREEKRKVEENMSALESVLSSLK
jgi:hypothetical protein